MNRSKQKRETFHVLNFVSYLLIKIRFIKIMQAAEPDIKVIYCGG
jgi:hypothetical protein